MVGSFLRIEIPVGIDPVAKLIETEAISRHILAHKVVPKN